MGDVCESADGSIFDRCALCSIELFSGIDRSVVRRLDCESLFIRAYLNMHEGDFKDAVLTFTDS